MDRGKHQSHRKPRQTHDPHQENRTPEIVGTWSLRNREQLKKRKAEVQEKQTSQWLFGEQKKGKRQRTEKENERDRKRQRATKLKMKPEPQVEKERMVKALTSTKQETDPPGCVTKAFTPGATQEKAVAKECIPEICQDNIIHQENCSEYQEIGAQSHPSEACQNMAEPEDLSPKMCQKIAVLQEHPSRIYQDMAEPEDISPKMGQEVVVLQDHPSRMYEDMIEPEDLSSKTCQGTAVPIAIPSKTSENTAGLEGCSPEIYPKPDVPKDYPLETDKKPVEPKEWNSEPDQGTAETKSVFPKTHAIAMPKDLSTKTCQETKEPEYFSHKTYQEMIVPKVTSPKMIQKTSEPEEYSPEIHQETPEPEEYSPEVYQETARAEEHLPEMYQETSGPEDLSTKTCTNKDGPKECFLVPYQETGEPEGQDLRAHQEDAKEVYTFPPEMKEKPKAEEPEIPANLNSPPKGRPEKDIIYSYVLY
ncbi:PREDICTED: hemogen [Chrysochloris asiatica]|uniref:Hemogen n=1 Tax=Chrysochloris asiatica TaxID=185453 RepID=A0A9B0WQG3_CHRAS|nr:PREDICTED: hemogen [Chrysochloris asiatica]